MADRIIYVNTNVNTGTYGNPDGTRGAGVRDGTSRTKGYRKLAEAFAQTANFLTQELGGTTLTEGNNLIYRLSGTTADDAVSDMGTSTWNVAGSPDDETRVVVEGDPDVASGAIEGLIWNTGKYRLNYQATTEMIYARKSATFRNFQIGADYYNLGWCLRVHAPRTLIHGMVFASTHASTIAGRGVVTSNAGVSRLRIINCGFYRLSWAITVDDYTDWAVGAECTIANNIISRCGETGYTAIRYLSGGTPRANLRVMNNCIVALNSGATYIGGSGMSSVYIGYNATDGTIAGQSNGIDNITPANAITAPTPGSVLAFDLSIKDVNSALVNAGLAYSGSGNAQYVPQTDYLGRARGTAGRGWDIGPDSWFTEGGGGGGGGGGVARVRRGIWI